MPMRRRGNSVGMGAFRLQILVGDEFRWVWMREALRNAGKEGLVFHFAMLAKASGDPGEVGVVVTGVADELEGAVAGKRAEELGEAFAGEVAGGGDADRPVGGADGRGPKCLEAGFELAKRGQLSTAEQTALAEGVGPARFEGITDRGDAREFECTEQRAQDGGEEGGVFVRVDVAEGNARVLDTPDMRDGFLGDVVGIDLAAHHGDREGGQGAAKIAAVGTEQR